MTELCRYERGPRASGLAWGKEEQGSWRSFRRKAETKLSGLCGDARGI